jgi:hypothetical protein
VDLVVLAAVAPVDPVAEIVALVVNVPEQVALVLLVKAETVAQAAVPN